MPWDPVRDLLTMQERLENLFGEATPGWIPAADLYETADRFVLTVELPGLERSDVNLAYAADTLTVAGRRPTPAACERYQQFERAQGAFARRFRFAVPIEPDQITADLADGVLTVTIPKAPAGRRPSTIEIT
ncbi:MAG TPA: Hsp20/alpha crystallin family protein [Vicinamibacterales bacterium]|jgi:HSP20 family protein|nr:Hsp20/alpha crystallin family protein [Vicinamibacterales bacterium]